MKDIDTWDKLAAEIARLERENERLRGGDGCEMCTDVKGYDIILLYETNIIADYCPFCGKELNRESE